MSQTVGYNYFVGMQLSLCHGPIDEITKIKVGDAIAWEGVSTGGTITINEPDLFGGKSREGGIVGDVSLEMGGPAQTANSYLVSVLGSLVPAFRRVTCLVLEQVNLGMNPYLKNWEVLATRIHTAQEGAAQWQDGLAQIDVTVYDANGDPVTIKAVNPIHIIRETLTNTLWGMGYSSADIDETSFLAAATTLYDEGMGMCILWDTQKSIEDFVKLIQQHIGADLYVDRRTGLFTIKLIRNDYDVGTLLELDTSSIDKVEDIRRPAFGELCNSITIKYHDVLNNKEAAMSLQDIASIQEQGAEVSTSVTYEGFVDPDTVGRVLQRDLTALGSPLISCTVYATKQARSLKVGDCFKLTWPDANMSEEVMRVTEVAYGNGRQRRVRIKCIQDVFSYPSSSLVVRPATGWTSHRTPPSAPVDILAFEMPYYALVKASGATLVDSAVATNPSLGYVAGASSPPSSSYTNGAIYTDDGTGYEDAGNYEFCPAGELTSDIGYLTTSITLTNDFLLSSVSTNTWAQIDDELVAVTAVAGNVVTMTRGALDTTPSEHLAGAKMLFWDSDYGLDPTEYIDSDSIDVKLVAQNGSGTSGLSGATAMTVDVVGRLARPFLPGKIQFDGGYYPDPSTVFTTDITMSWAHRNRVLETGGTLVGFTDSSVTVEAGTTYEVFLYTGADVLVHSYTGITGTSQVLSAAHWGAIAGGILRVRLKSKRDGLYSFQTFSYDLTIPNIRTEEDGTVRLLESGTTRQME